LLKRRSAGPERRRLKTWEEVVIAGPSKPNRFSSIDRATVLPVHLYSCQWNYDTLSLLLVGTLKERAPDSQVRITGSRKGTAVHAESMEDFREGYARLRRVDDPTRASSLEVEHDPGDVHVQVQIWGEGTTFVVGSMDRDRVLGMLDMLRDVGLRAGGRDGPVRLLRWSGLSSGLGATASLAGVGILVGMIPATAIPLLLSAAGVVLGGVGGLWLGRRRAERGRTTIRLSGETELLGSRGWNRSDKIPIGGLVLTIGILATAVAGLWLSHHDAQDAQGKPTRSVSAQQ
jgi:hypothetical protein